MGSCAYQTHYTTAIIVANHLPLYAQNSLTVIMDAIQDHSSKNERRNHTGGLTLLLDGAMGPDGKKNKVDPERKNKVCDGVWR